jgi:HSP20 family protein
MKYLEPFRVSRRMHRRFEELFDRMHRDVLETPFLEEVFTPIDTMVLSVDIKDTENEIIVTTDIPGVKKEDISITVDNSVLEINASREELTEDEKKDYWKKERICTQFYRSVHLPASVNEENIKASFKDGVLEIKLPKAEIAKKKEILIE